MANRGSFLAQDQLLSVDDYLVSNNGLFFAVMQGDGNFCVYRGSGPSDNRGYLWGALNQAQTGGPFFAVMQGDGNFCVYKGKGPADNGGSVWCTNAIDPVIDVEISSIQYDVDPKAVKTLLDAPVELYRQAVSNQTTQAQTSAINGSASVSETSGWSDSLALNVGGSAKFKTGLPFVGEGEVTVSTSMTTTFISNGSTTRTKTWGFNTPLAFLRTQQSLAWSWQRSLPSPCRIR